MSQVLSFADHRQLSTSAALLKRNFCSSGHLWGALLGGKRAEVVNHLSLLDRYHLYAFVATNHCTSVTLKPGLDQLSPFEHLLSGHCKIERMHKENFRLVLLCGLSTALKEPTVPQTNAEYWDGSNGRLSFWHLDLLKDIHHVQDEEGELLLPHERDLIKKTGPEAVKTWLQAAAGITNIRDLPASFNFLNADIIGPSSRPRPSLTIVRTNHL